MKDYVAFLWHLSVGRDSFAKKEKLEIGLEIVVVALVEVDSRI
jgi:hypothetical protein